MSFRKSMEQSKEEVSDLALAISRNSASLVSLDSLSLRSISSSISTSSSVVFFAAGNRFDVSVSMAQRISFSGISSS